ncbi:hypothetical protein [Vibrio cholerae]|uniref:hypothetical protein n=1 Tax=Vibrio cholerae TaxID=666 RepID=UPI00084A5FEA|nr:hypothetical protein [Vibrio cholerae]OEC29962.1 hypothetical protein BFX13_18325 [Vibrio cholerae]
MIELLKLDEQTRHRLLRNILETKKPFYSRHNYLEPPVKQLVTLYGKEYEKEIRCIVTLASRCQRYKAEGFRLHLTDEWYTKNNALTKQGINRSKMSKIVHLMDRDGWITFCKGFPKWDNQKEQSQVSAIIVKNLDTIIDKRMSEKQAPNLDELMDNIEFIDTKSTTVTKEFNSKGVLTKDKTYSYLTPNNTKPFFGLTQKRENLFAYNKLLQSFLIHDGEQVLKCVLFKRRFEDDLSGAGRYWCDAIQGLSKMAPNANREGYRSLLTIGGEQVSEADFKTIQPRILYLEEGVFLDDSFDVYGATLHIEGWDKTEVRSFIKGCMMSILFSSNRAGAKASITEKLKGHNIQHLITSEQVVTAIEEHNRPISHRFYNKSYYSKLQNYEARIAEFVIDSFTSVGKPVLCIHDSFVVRKQDNDLLIRLMRDGWLEVLGTRRNCVVQTEYGYAEIAGIEHTLELIPLEAYDDSYFTSTATSDQTDTTLISFGLDMLPLTEEEEDTPNLEELLLECGLRPFTTGGVLNNGLQGFDVDKVRSVNKTLIDQSHYCKECGNYTHKRDYCNFEGCSSIPF